MSSEYSFYLTVGRAAPSAEEAFAGAIIPDAQDTMAITELRAAESVAGSIVELDNSTEPPTLRLEKAIGKVLWGRVNHQGRFVEDFQDFEGGFVGLSGNYTGPGSVLKIL